MKYNYENLEIYKLAMEFIKEIYIITKLFTKTELYGLISQIKRAAISVALNIVEGCNRYSYKNFARFIRMSIGPLMETRCCLEIAKQLNFINNEQFDSLDKNTEKLYFKLVALHKWLKAQN